MLKTHPFKSKAFPSCVPGVFVLIVQELSPKKLRQIPNPFLRIPHKSSQVLTSRLIVSTSRLIDFTGRLIVSTSSGLVFTGAELAVLHGLCKRQAWPGMERDGRNRFVRFAAMADSLPARAA